MRLRFAKTLSGFAGFRQSAFASVFIILFLLPGVIQANDIVHHTVSFPESGEQLFLVRSEFPVRAEVTELIMPNWTPGSYLIRDHAANVNRIFAVSGNGVDLSVQKISKDHWKVDTGQAKTLIVEYEVYTPKIRVQNSWASRAFSLINGASVFLYTRDSREEPQSLEVDADRNRGEVFTAMSPAPGGRGYLAKNYDELVDNPVVIARAPVYQFTSKGQEYVLLNVGENEFWDGQQAARDVKKIVAETQSFWDTNPLTKPYWFLNFIVEAKGGLEHDHSTVIMTGRRQMRNRDAYIKWLGVVAHEFFHVWNVRHMRPVELADIDYQNEQYTSQLWLAEGLTSFYDNLLLVRAGLIKPEEYLDLLAQDIFRLETTPGRSLRPVTEASIDAWIRQYQPGSNSLNSNVSYYIKGAVIGFVLDTYLRSESRGRTSLDNVMREMYRQHANKPYGREAFERIVVDMAGAEAGAFLDTLLRTTAELDVDHSLGWYGLALDRFEPDSEAGSNDGPAVSGLGVLWDEGKSGMVVKTVLSGSGGQIAGLIPGDEVLAIGDERLTRDTLDSLVTSFRPGEETTLLVSRRGRIISLDARLDSAIPDRFQIKLKSSHKNYHINRLQRLLGQNLRKP
jgi:predicted metalloprotease with PDZ domain